MTKFDNQDPGVQVTAATVDELRFWSYERYLTNSIADSNRFRTYDEINEDMNVHVDSETEGLEAYYRFETLNSVLADEEGAWDGSVQTYPGGETALVYEVTEVVFNTFATAQQTVPSVITLTATDADGSDITYYVSTLPEHGALYVVSPTGNFKNNSDVMINKFIRSYWYKDHCCYSLFRFAIKQGCLLRH